MKKNSATSKKVFVACMIKKATETFDRAVCFLYYHSVVQDAGLTLAQLAGEFVSAHLKKPHVTWLHRKLKKDPRVVNSGGDAWRIRGDKIDEVKTSFNLTRCLASSRGSRAVTNGAYVSQSRIENLRNSKNEEFDFQRLLQMFSELDDAYANENYISVILLVRAIMDHVSPIFDCKDFAEVASQHGGRSFKKQMRRLEESARPSADYYLHQVIRRKESLPDEMDVNFSKELNALLAEIIRITETPSD